MSRHKTVRRKSRGAKRSLSFFIARGNKFAAGGISRRRGPYVLGGYRRGKMKLKVSAGREGVKASASLRIAPRTEVGIEHSMSSGRTRLLLRRKKRRLAI